MKVTVRRATQSDYGYIVHSAARETPPKLRVALPHLSGLALTACLDAVVRGASLILVACDEKDPDTLVGWLIEHRELQLLYVAFDYRRRGIAHLLKGHASCAA